MKTVVVLEDMSHRVDWLRANVPLNVDVRWHKTVTDLFEGWLEPETSIDLLILDHDLGDVSASDYNEYGHSDRGSRGSDGMSGMTAVCAMPRVSCPVIVWSRNPQGAARMATEVKHRGMTALVIPFGEDGLREAIAAILRGVA